MHWLGTIDWGPWLTLVIRAVAFFFYADHLRRVVRQYLDERTPRVFRSFVIAAVVAIGTFALLLGGVVLIYEDFRTIARIFGALAAGAVLVGGIFVFVSHRVQGNAR